MLTKRTKKHPNAMQWLNEKGKKIEKMVRSDIDYAT